MSLDELIERALAEDVGGGDATTEATVPAAARGRATITQKAPGVISGLTVAGSKWTFDDLVRLSPPTWSNKPYLHCELF